MNRLTRSLSLPSVRKDFDCEEQTNVLNCHSGARENTTDFESIHEPIQARSEFLWENFPSESGDPWQPMGLAPAPDLEHCNGGESDNSNGRQSSGLSRKSCRSCRDYRSFRAESGGFRSKEDYVKAVEEHDKWWNRINLKRNSVHGKDLVYPGKELRQEQSNPSSERNKSSVNRSRNEEFGSERPDEKSLKPAENSLQGHFCYDSDSFARNLCFEYSPDKGRIGSSEQSFLEHCSSESSPSNFEAEPAESPMTYGKTQPLHTLLQSCRSPDPESRKSCLPQRRKHRKITECTLPTNGISSESRPRRSTNKCEKLSNTSKASISSATFLNFAHARVEDDAVSGTARKKWKKTPYKYSYNHYRNKLSDTFEKSASGMTYSFGAAQSWKDLGRSSRNDFKQELGKLSPTLVTNLGGLALRKECGRNIVCDKRERTKAGNICAEGKRVLEVKLDKASMYGILKLKQQLSELKRLLNSRFIMDFKQSKDSVSYKSCERSCEKRGPHCACLANFSAIAEYLQISSKSSRNDTRVSDTCKRDCHVGVNSHCKKQQRRVSGDKTDGNVLSKGKYIVRESGTVKTSPEPLGRDSSAPRLLSYKIFVPGKSETKINTEEKCIQTEVLTCSKTCQASPYLRSLGVQCSEDVQKNRFRLREFERLKKLSPVWHLKPEEGLGLTVKNTCNLVELPNFASKRLQNFPKPREKTKFRIVSAKDEKTLFAEKPPDAQRLSKENDEPVNDEKLISGRTERNGVVVHNLKRTSAVELPNVVSLGWTTLFSRRSESCVESVDEVDEQKRKSPKAQSNKCKLRFENKVEENNGRNCEKKQPLRNCLGTKGTSKNLRKKSYERRAAFCRAAKATSKELSTLNV